MQTMEWHEIAAWLGEDWAEEQRDQIHERYERLVRDYDITDPDESEALLVLIAQQVDGTLDPEEVRQAHVTRQQLAQEARRALQALVRLSVADGMPEAEAARRYGISRPTVRAWLGKG